MRKKVFVISVLWVVSVVLAAVVMWAVVTMGFLDTTPYTEVMDCIVIGEAYQPAIGDIFTITTNKTDYVKVQKSQCYNMDSVVTGDEFTAVAVYDEKGVLLSITKVSE